MMPFGLESIAAVAATQPAASAGVGLQLDAPQSSAAPSPFADLIQRGLGELNANVGAAETAMRDFAAGKSVQLHEVMISLERAHLSVQTFLQIRNKLVESYQDVMRMQM